MAGVPVKSIEIYLRKLLQAGHRVAVCDQVEDAALAKGLVKREVTRVVTPGTVTEDELLEPGRPNHLVAVVPGRTICGIAWVEATTGEFRAADVPADRLARRDEPPEPRGVLAGRGRGSEHPGVRCELRCEPSRPGPTGHSTRSPRGLLSMQHFKVITLSGFGFEDHQPCVTAAGGLLIYLQETLKASLAHVRRLLPYRASNHLTLDEVTRRSLELTRTLRDGQREGSLLRAMNRTVTPMGARALHDAVLSPLADEPPSTPGSMPSRNSFAKPARGTTFARRSRTSRTFSDSRRVSAPAGRHLAICSDLQALRLSAEDQGQSHRPAGEVAARTRRPAGTLPRPPRVARSRPSR